MDSTNAFHDLITQRGIAVVPGCYDALSAAILEREGFDAVYLSGAGVSNTRLGLADLGLTSYDDMLDQARTVVARVDIPVFADADTGYGNAVNVHRTVQGYEQVGVDALHIEDQDTPKRCGHFAGKSLVPQEEMVQKVRAATNAAEDIAVVARTDARQVDGVDAAIARGNAYADAGADMVFPEAPRSKQELARCCDEIDAPVMANMVEDGDTPLMAADELEELGVAVVIFPNSLLRAAMVTMTDAAAHLREHGTTRDLDGVADFDLRNALTDYDRLTELADRYAADD